MPTDFMGRVMVVFNRYGMSMLQGAGVSLKIALVGTLVGCLKCAFYFKLIQQIWADKDILLIEGEKSRLGVGNDLFDNVKSIRRILAPNTNAFDHYDAIMKIVQKYSPNEYLILLALGPTATVMAYNLAQKGYQAIDIGHIDIEYEWYRMGASHKVPIPSKYVNEADAGVGVGDIHDEKYKKEIICRF